MRAMKPSLTVSVSGVSPVPLLTAGTLEGLDEELVPPELQPCAKSVPAAVAPTVSMNFLREKPRAMFVIDFVRKMSDR